MTCKHSGYLYDLTCESCKTRFIQSETCKYLRKVLVAELEPKYGEFADWKEGQTCTCVGICERKARVKTVKDDEQQIVSKGKKASCKR